jgi:purine-binding chemotaxis protein CheW
MEFCTFEVDGLRFGVPVDRVQEVLRPQPMTPVPRSSDVVTGLINLRGQIVTAIDLRRRLEMADREDQGTAMNVVVRTDSGPVSLLVDVIGDVTSTGDIACDPPPDTLRGVARELIVGAYQLSDRLLLQLDVDRATDIPVGAGR